MCILMCSYLLLETFNNPSSLSVYIYLGIVNEGMKPPPV